MTDTPDLMPCDMALVDLVKHAGKMAAAIYIATDKVVADDVSATLRALVVKLQASQPQKDDAPADRAAIVEECARVADRIYDALDTDHLAGWAAAPEINHIRVAIRVLKGGAA